MQVTEVIRKEGSEIVLYSSDGEKVLGRFPFGKGKKYQDETAARAAAHKREGQVQFFKTHGEALGPAVRQAVTAFCDQAAPLLESAALREAGIDAIVAKWKSWAGSYRKCVEVLSGKKDVSEPEALCAWLHHEAEGIWPGDTPPPGPNEAYFPDVAGLLAEAGQVRFTLVEVGAKHTQSEIMLIDRIIRYLEIIRDGEITAAEAEELAKMGIKVKATTTETTESTAPAAAVQEAAPIDSFEERSQLIDAAWGSLYPWQQNGLPQPHIIGTYEDYVIARDGTAYFQVAYQVNDTGAIVFAARGDWIPVTLSWTAVTAPPAGEAVAAGGGAPTPGGALRESCALTILGRLQEAANIPDSGPVPCVLVEAGESLNGNVYSPEVLQAAIPLFEGVQMFVDHPTRSQQRERPEGSVRDLAGKVSAVQWDATGLRARALISESAGWLRTLVREGIAGDLSINAEGQGRKENGKFIVEAITRVNSVDFVTKGAARGRILEAIAAYQPASWEDLTLEAVAAHRPDILNELASRERDKLYHGKEETLREAQAAPALRAELETTQNRITALESQLEARAVADVVEQLLSAETALPAAAQAEVRRQLVGVSLADAPARATAAIQAQKNVVAQVLEAGTVRGHGSTASGGNEAHDRLVAAYIAGGLTPEQAAIAARGRM